MKRPHELSPRTEAAGTLAALTRLGPRYLESGLAAMREASRRHLGAEDRLQSAVAAMVREIGNDMRARTEATGSKRTGPPPAGAPPIPPPAAPWKKTYGDEP